MNNLNLQNPHPPTTGTLQTLLKPFNLLPLHLHAISYSIAFRFLVHQLYMASKVLRIASHEAENQFELSLRQAFELLEPKLRPPFPLKIPTPQEYSQLNMAILYGVLCEPYLAKTHMKHLHAIVVDGYSFYVSLVIKIVNELYVKLVESAKLQLVWIAKEMINVSAVGIDGLLVSLLRQIVGGDFSEGNMWLCFELVSLFWEKWDWVLEEEPMVLTSALFTYLRVLADHCRLSTNAKLEALKRVEIDFCVRALREQFHLCLKIGRDLVRLLQDLVHVPEFRAIWKDLLLNPGEFGTAAFSDISQIYRVRTSSRYFLLRITPEMETQLRFLLTHVKLGSQKRYQAWFARKFLRRPERETLICDIVRFICCAHHPPNEIIQSDVIPRWAVLGWLLKSCRKNYVEATVKLALFYDWLFFDERVDNIMNVEPAMLLMVRSIPKYIDVTHTLLEFLFLLVDNYFVELNHFVVQGVSSTFSILVRKGVVHSLDVFTSCDALSPFLKERIGRFLKEGVFRESELAHLPGHFLRPINLPSLSTVEIDTPLPGGLRESTFARKDGLGTEPVDTSTVISDEPVTSCSPFTPLVMGSESQVNAIEKLVQNLGKTIRKSYAMGLRTLEEILFSLANLDSQRLPSNFVEFSSCIIAKEFKLNGYKLFSPLEFLPNNPICDAEIQSATALLTRGLVFSQHESMLEMFLFWSRENFPVGACLLSYAVRLASEAQTVLENNSIKVSDSGMPLLKFHADGYISFMSSKRKDSPEAIDSTSEMDSKFFAKFVDGAFAAYRYFLTYSMNILYKEANTSLAKLLFSDLMSCCEAEHKRLKYLFCSVLFHLSEFSVGEEDFIRLLVGRLDHANLVDMQFDIGLKKFSIFGGNTGTIFHLIKSSLSWGSMEQHKFWGLIRSELAVSKVQVEKLILEFFCSGVLDPNVNSIAVGGLLTLCSCRAPTPELVGAIMLLPNNTFQGFAAAVLATWFESNASMLLDSLANFLERLDNKNGDSILMNSSGIMINHSAISCLLNYFDAQGISGNNILRKLLINIPDKESVMQL